MANLADVTAKVQRILANNWSTELRPDGSFFLRFESTGCRVKCFEMGETGSVAVGLSAPILFDVPVSDDLFRWVATQGADYTFGNAHLFLDEGAATAQLFFSQTILGDFLDAEELNIAVMAVGFTADRLDDELLPRFGGRRAADPAD